MFGRFMPTEGKFFEIFNEHAKCIVSASHELELLIDNLQDAEIHKQNVQKATKPSICCTRRSSRRSTATKSTS
jgi:uncharacterized protein Yka (UPF0111/DUF47 family)